MCAVPAWQFAAATGSGLVLGALIELLIIWIFGRDR